MSSFSLPVRPRDMTKRELSTFQDFMKGKLSNEEQDKFYNELLQHAKMDREMRKEALKRKNEPLMNLNDEEMEILKKSKVFENEPDSHGLVGTEDYLEEWFDEATGIDAKAHKGKGGHRRKHRSTKKHHKKSIKSRKSKTHKKRKMHKKHNKTHRH